MYLWMELYSWTGGFYFEDRLEDFGRRGYFRGPNGILKTEIGMRKATDSRESRNLGRRYWKAAKACWRINFETAELGAETDVLESGESAWEY